MRLARTSVIYFFSDLVTSVVGFLATLYFARVLGSTALGKYFLVVAFVGWLSIPSHGVGDAIAKRMSEGVDRGEILSAGFLLNGALAVVLSVGVLSVRTHVDAYIGADVAVLFAGLLGAQMMFNSVLSALSGQHMVAYIGILKTVDRLLRVVIQVSFVLLGYTVGALVGGEVLAVAISVLFGVLLFEVDVTMPTFGHVRKLLTYAKYSWLSNIKAKTFSWMDTIILSLFVGSGLIAVYEVSWRLASILVLVSKAVHQTLFPEMSKIAEEGDQDALLDLLDEGLFAAGLFVIPGLIGALILGHRILQIYGPAFTQGTVVLPILIVALGVDAYASQFETLVNAFDRPDLMFRVNTLFVVTNAVLNVVLISQLGFVGAAIATATSSSLVLVFGYYFTHTRVGSPSVPIRDITFQLLAGGAMGGAIILLRRAVPWSNMYVTVALVLAGAAIYVLVLFAISARFRRKATNLVPVEVPVPGAN